MLLDTDMNRTLAVMPSQLQRTPTGPRFDDIRIHTATTRRSVMGRSQFEAYNREFDLGIPIRTSVRKEMRGIGGSGRILRDAMIQITFVTLGLIIDVDFSILAENSPSPL